MTQDEIIEMVMQIGGCDRPEDDSPALKMFVAFAKLVAEKEREACAKLIINNIEMARQAGFVDYELDDGTTNAFDKRYEAFAKLVAEKAIKEALAQPEQYPQIAINPEIVGYVAPQLKIEGSRHVICQCDKCKAHPEQEPVYTHPAKDLEDIEINITWNENSMRDFGKDELNFARAIEAKLKEKNTLLKNNRRK